LSLLVNNLKAFLKHQLH